MRYFLSKFRMSSSAYLSSWRKRTARVNAMVEENSSGSDDLGPATITGQEIEGRDFAEEVSHLSSGCNAEEQEQELAYLEKSDTEVEGSPIFDSCNSSSDDDKELHCHFGGGSAGGDDEDESVVANSLQQELASWVSRNKCTREATNELLEILRNNGHSSLPKDSRTLLQTPRIIQSIEKCGGQYIYFGVERGIHKTLTNHALFCTNNVNIKLMFNIDGIPLFKSSNVQMWPILCSFNGYEVFIVALYCGVSKPTSVEEYLKDLVDELATLTANGTVFQGKPMNVIVHCFACDAPARAFLKCTISHTGYHSCERCTVKGSWNGRVVYNSNVRFPMRNLETFNNIGYQPHQKKASPLVDGGVNCLNGFSLDYMHLVCLGVVKRIINFWRSGPKECRLSHGQLNQISNQLTQFRGRMPSDFARQPRSLFESDRWKATEFRQFLLYTGPVVLKSVLPNATYRHFLSLSIAMSIMLDSDQRKRERHIDYAKQLLQYFVENCKFIFGETFSVYNVHGLLHLSEDVIHFDSSLNEISCFQFENHLQILKRFVRNAQNPVVQVAKRQSELEAVPTKIPSMQPYNKISVNTKDNCFLLPDKKFAFVREIRSRGQFLCDVVDLHSLENIFTSPAESKTFNIGYCRNIERFGKRRLVEKADFIIKVVCLPFADGQALFPMLHNAEK